MKFMILMSEDPSWDALTEEEQNLIIEEHDRFEADLNDSGSFISSCRFGPESGSAIHQSSSGEIGVIPNPASGEGSIGGYYLIDVASMEAALEWAKRCRFVTGTNWVYPVWK